MKKILKYTLFWLLTPLWLPGFIIWIFLLWNNEYIPGCNTAWQALKTVCSKPDPICRAVRPSTQEKG